MKTLELANIINFINDIREEKTFLIKGFFKESKTPLIKKEKYIFDNIDEEISHIYLGSKDEFDLNKLDEIMSLILKNNLRMYQIDANSFITKKIKKDGNDFIVEGLVENWDASKPITFIIKKNEGKDNYTVSNDLFEDKFTLDL